MRDEINILVNIGARNAGRDAYVVHLQQEGRPLSNIWARIDRQTLLADKHSFSARDYSIELYAALFTGALGRA